MYSSQKSKRFSMRYLTETALIAALYVVFTYLSFFLGISSGVIQFRLSEVLCGLCALTGASVPGLTLGCFLANLLTGCPLPDIIIGTLATFLGALCGYALRRSSVFCVLPTVVFNTVLVPPVLIFVYHTETAWPLVFLSVFVGEAVCAGIGGFVLVLLLRRHHLLKGDKDMKKRGKFIVMEGIDGAGKTTQIELLASDLKKIGIPVFVTREPTDLATGKKLRLALAGKIASTEEQMCDMFVEDRIAHNLEPNEGIRAMLEKGTTVICDRYYYSTLAYQGSTLDYDSVRRKNVGVKDILRPDLCLFLDLTPAESLRRISAGRDFTEIYENEETLSRVRTSFHRVIDDLSSEEKIEVIDASRSIEEVSADVIRSVRKLF